MPEPETYESKIKIARERFSRRLNHKTTRIKCSFDWWFERFKDDCASFDEIGKGAGFKPSAAREAARQIYQLYFATLLPNRPDGHTRRKFCTLKTNKLRAKNFPGESSFLLQKIAQLAYSAGCKMELVPRITPSKFHKIRRFSSKSVLLNGKWRVRIHCCTKLSETGSKAHYATTSLSRRETSKYDFVIIHSNIAGHPERVFVVPVSVILEHWPKQKRTKTLSIYLKNTGGHRGRCPQIDFWQYLDAWHLFEV